MLDEFHLCCLSFHLVAGTLKLFQRPEESTFRETRLLLWFGSIFAVTPATAKAAAFLLMNSVFLC